MNLFVRFRVECGLGIYDLYNKEIQVKDHGQRIYWISLIIRHQNIILTTFFLLLLQKPYPGNVRLATTLASMQEKVDKPLTMSGILLELRVFTQSSLNHITEQFRLFDPKYSHMYSTIPVSDAYPIIIDEMSFIWTWFVPVQFCKLFTYFYVIMI